MMSALINLSQAEIIAMHIMEGAWLNTCQQCHSLEKMGSAVSPCDLYISLATYYIS